MKTPHLFILLLATCLTTLTLAWSKEDHELFRVRDELNTLQGGDVSFYDFLGVPKSATLDEINKQNKKRSRQLHPDKAIPALVAARSAPQQASSPAGDKSNPKSNKDKSNKKKPGVTVTPGATQKERAAIAKEANARYALYSVVVKILRSPEERSRYDHFLRNGFPAWRGTGYYFKRYRPGLGVVLFGLLLVFGGAGHYGAMWVGYQRQKKFVEKYVDKARTAAWGSSGGIPGVTLGSGTSSGTATPPQQQLDEDNDQQGPMVMNRRQRRGMEKEDKKKKSSASSSPAPSARTMRAVRDRDISAPVDGQPIPAATKKRVMAENGKVLIVDSNGKVFLEETTEEGDTQEFLLDPEDIPQPTIYQTALFRLPIFLYSQSVGRLQALTGKPSGSVEPGEPFFDDDGAVMVESAVGDEELVGEAAIGNATAVNVNQEARNRRGKVGGRGGRMG